MSPFIASQSLLQGEYITIFYQMTCSIYGENFAVFKDFFGLKSPSFKGKFLKRKDKLVLTTE